MSKLVIKGKRIGEGRPLVCVPVIEQERNEIIREITFLSQSGADMIEWRVDRFLEFRDCNAVREILAAVAPVLKDKLFLYTFRSREQGGAAEADTRTLADIQALAMEAGCVDLIDLEYFKEAHPSRRIRHLQEGGLRVITSHHDFCETPEPKVMQLLLEQMCAGGADIVKLAVMPQSVSDVLKLLEVTAQFCEAHPDTPIITMSMGRLGSVSRLCGETFGSCVTFGSHEKPSAPGQYEMHRLREVLDIIHESCENDEKQHKS